MKRRKQNKGFEMSQRQADGTISNGEIMNAMLGDEPDVSHTSREWARMHGFTEVEVDKMHPRKVKE
jgi:hypothetical protein